ncbi:hypothetical protein Aduo_013603 [Ancylostoma duodenale]
MDLRPDVEEQNDIVAATMKSVQRVLSFCPPEVLQGNAGEYSSNGQLLAPVGVDPSRSGPVTRAQIIAELYTLIANLSRLTTDCERLTEYTFELGKKIVPMDGEDPSLKGICCDTNEENESSLDKGEKVATMDGPVDGEERATGRASEVFWIPITDKELETAAKGQNCMESANPGMKDDKLAEHTIVLDKQLSPKNRNSVIKMPTNMNEENESSLEEGEEATSLDDPFDGREVVTCPTNEVFWIPFSDNEVETGSEEHEHSEVKRRRSLSVSCILILLYLLCVTVSYLVYSQKKFARRLSLRLSKANDSTSHNENKYVDLTPADERNDSK